MIIYSQKHVYLNRKGSVVVDFSVWVEDSVEQKTLKDIFMKQSQFTIENELVDLESFIISGKFNFSYVSTHCDVH